MGKLIALCGLPRCGKSTWARQFEEYDFDTLRNVKENIRDIIIKEKRIVINGDSIREALHGDRYHKESEQHVFAIIETVINSLLDTGHTVCFDECNTSIVSLFRIFKLDYDAQIILFDATEEECINRAELLRQDYLIPVIRNSQRNLDFLANISGYDLAYVNWDENRIDETEEFYNYVKKSIEIIRRIVKSGFTLNQLIEEICI